MSAARHDAVEIAASAFLLLFEARQGFARMADEGGNRRSAILLDAVDPEMGGLCKI